MGRLALETRASGITDPLGTDPKLIEKSIEVGDVIDAGDIEIYEEVE